MKGQHVVLSGHLVSTEEVEVEEVVVEAKPVPAALRFPRAKVRVPRISLHNFLPSFTDERAHDLF